MRQLSRMLIRLSVGVLCLYVSQSCTSKKAVAPSKLPSALVVIDPHFTNQSLNERVGVSTTLTAQDLTHKDLKTWFSKHTAKVNQKKESILLGSFRKYPQAWFYVQVVNTTHSTQQLVVDEFNRIRCDDFEVLTSQGGRVKRWGRIGRATPFSGYPFPFFTYAVPFTIPPKDTLSLIVHTQRHYGAHEVNLNIYTYENYLSEHIVLFLSKIFELIVFVICALVMFIVGWIFRYKTMAYLGFYLLSVVYVKLNYLGFTDAFTNFTEIGLSGTNANVFALYVSAIVIHPFWMAWMKVVPKNEKIFNGISYSMMGFNLFCVACFLLPIRLFNTVYAYIDLSLLMLLSCLVVLLWMIYCSLIALLRVKIYYMFIAIMVIFLPWLLQQFSSIFFGSSLILTYINPLTFIATPVGLSIVTTFLLGKQLISRRKYQENLSYMRDTMDDIRRAEIASIGSTLNDQVGNTLASALNHLDLKEFKPYVVKDLILDAINELRLISHNLVKDDSRVLSEKVASLTERLSDATPTRFTFDDFSEKKLDMLSRTIQQNIYAVIQELLTNVVKHAQAHEVLVQFFDTEGILRIVVEDDGLGFDPQQASGGIGLKNIQSRVALMKGQLTIDSTPQGTTTIIDITP
ncbi:MAG: ATP-binding protein [Spirosomataceae bacterium]